MLYSLRALKNGQCGVKKYITFGDEWSEEVHTYFLYIWLIIGGDGPMLVDTGPRDVEGFNAATRQYIPVGVTQQPDETTLGALAKAGVDPEDVTHVFITHTHPDHFENHYLFPNARVVVNERAFPGGLDRAPADLRDRLILARDEEIVPGIRTLPLGLHSDDSQAILIDTHKGRAVLSGDVAYMFDNLVRRRPIRCEDIDGALAAVDRLNAAGDIVLPGHDPEILRRYPDGIIA